MFGFTNFRLSKDSLKTFIPVLREGPFGSKNLKTFFFYYIFGCDPTQQSLQTKLKVYEFANVQKICTIAKTEIRTAKLLTISFIKHYNNMLL